MAVIENVIPILRVRDVEASRRYYVGTLGFALEWDADGMIAVARDRKSIMLCEGGQGQPGTWPSFRRRARISEAHCRISPGPTNSRSRTPMGTCCASAPSPSPGRRMESSGTDAPCARASDSQRRHTECCIRFHWNATTTAL